METSDRKALETIGEAARRLLCRLDERAKTSGEMPEKFMELDRARPCPTVEKVPLAPGGFSASGQSSRRVGEEARQGWPEGLFVHVDEGREPPQRYGSPANENRDIYGRGLSVEGRSAMRSPVSNTDPYSDVHGRVLIVRVSGNGE